MAYQRVKVPRFADQFGARSGEMFSDGQGFFTPNSANDFADLLAAGGIVEVTPGSGSLQSSNLTPAALAQKAVTKGPPKTIVLAGDSLTQLQIEIGAPTATSATGPIATFGAIVAGSGYVNGQYNNIPLVPGISTGATTLGACGTGATANITVSGGAVTACVLNNPGNTYGQLDSLTVNNANLGGGSGFSIPVATIAAPYSTTVKVTVPATTSVAPGQQVTISNATQIEFNGCWRCAAIIDPTNLTITLNSPATVATPTGGVSLGLSTTLGNTGWYNYINGFKLQVLNNAGLSGDSSYPGVISNMPGLYARLTSDVFAYNPDLCTVLIGTNDILTLTANQIAANIQTICNAILSKGITVILISTPPLSTNYAGFSATISAKVMEIRRQCLAYVNATQNIYYVDTWQVLADPTSTTGAALSNLLMSDGIHQNGSGAALIGPLLGKVLSALGVQQIELAATQLDSYAVNTVSTNCINNPLMQGSGGTAGTNTTGTIPASWHSGTAGGGSQSVVSSVVARTVAADGDTCGNNWVNVFTSAANGDTVTLNSNVAFSSQFTNGQWLQAELDFGWSAATALKYCEIITIVTVAGNQYKSYWMGAVDQTNPATSFRGRVKGAPIQVPPGAITTVQLQVFAGCGGAGGVTITMGRTALRVYNTMAATNSN